MFVLRLAGVAALYFGAARLGLLLASIHGSVSPVWPATGVAIGVLLLGGFRYWPGIALGAFAANVMTPVAAGIAGAIALGNTLEALAGAFLFGCVARRFGRREAGGLGDLAEPVGFAVAAALAPVVSASVGVFALVSGGATEPALAGRLWVTWWVGDALGALMVAPLLTALRAGGPSSPGGYDAASVGRWDFNLRVFGRLTGVVLLGVVVCGGVFFQPWGGKLLFCLFPVLLLSVVWFGTAGVRVAAAAIAGVGICAAFIGLGPFSGGDLNEDLLHLQLFLTSVGTAALLLPLFRAAGNLVVPSAMLLSAWALSGWLFSALQRERLAADGPSPAIWAATISALVSLFMVGLVVSLHSGRRRAQATAAEHESALAKSEERFRLLIENVQDYGIFALDPEGRVTTWNPGAERITGYAAEEILGRHFSIFYPPEEVAAGKPGRTLAMAAAKGRMENEGVRIRKDESQFRANAIVSALRNPDRTRTGFVKIIRDITERRQLEENLARARDEALEASRLKSEFLATMSHEIRTPMNGIIGMSGLLMNTELSPEQRSMGHVIESSAERLLAVIDDILDFSIIEAGKMRLEPAEFELRHLVEETLGLLAVNAHEKGLELVSDFDFRFPVHLVGDAGRIRQVLMNLAGNAIKFSDRGEVTVSVGVKEGAPGHMAFRVSVRDRGNGVEPAMRPKLFEPFTQADGTASRRHGGSGLGLAISRRLVELMGGKIGFESETGKGSVFWFDVELPVGSGGQPKIEGVSALPAGTVILVVDDNATNRWILVEQLVHFGLRAKAVADGPAALAWLRAQTAAGEPCRLVLMDWHMPGMSGLHLAREIRADAAIAATQIMVLSSSEQLEDPAEVARLGFAAFLLKPVREAQLHRNLARALGAAEPAEPSVPGAVVGPRRLLLVEDNREDRILMQMLFEQTDYSVSMATNGQEAIDLLAREDFDVVLMDCQMPGMDGYEATRRIRSGQDRGVNASVPIVALTAHVLPGERQKCLTAGMDAYLTKPVRLAAMEEVFLRCGISRVYFPRTGAFGAGDS